MIDARIAPARRRNTQNPQRRTAKAHSQLLNTRIALIIGRHPHYATVPTGERALELSARSPLPPNLLCFGKPFEVTCHHGWS
jgi:hypothetical protein